MIQRTPNKEREKLKEERFEQGRETSSKGERHRARERKRERERREGGKVREGGSLTRKQLIR